MRQFRMPLEHSKNLTTFKRKIGSILRNLNKFDEKEKRDAFSYLQGCISAKRIEKNKLKRKRKTRGTFRKKTYKCAECEYTDSTRRGIYTHLKGHSGFPLSCRSCKKTFNNYLLFEWHLQIQCKPDVKKCIAYHCNECPRKFMSKHNLLRHVEGHRRNNCIYCEQVITNRKNLIEHLYNVHSIKLERAIYKCSLCDKRYVKKRSLYFHKKQHFQDKFVCLDCGFLCEDIDKIVEHQKEHENQKKFKCNKCDQRFSRRQQYLLHMKKHNNYRCLTCQESYASKINMVLHKQKGHNVEELKPKFSCSDCGKKFFQNSQLILHMKKHSEEKPTLNCHYCDKTFQSPYAYHKHSITVSHEKCSPETSVFVCENCGSQFPKKYLLEQHNTRTHNNKKEYVICEFCPYKTKNKANMKRHKDTHITNGKKFICDQCGKDFSNVASLKGHISYIHSKSKHFKCDQCEKTFKRNSELVRHQGTHSDARPHVCTLCGQSYKRLTHLRRHEKSSHNIESQVKPNLKLRIDSDGKPIPIKPEKKENPQSAVILTNVESSIPVYSLLSSEPLALVKRKTDHCNQILIAELSQEITYFDNICTNNTNSELNTLKDDVILDMSMMNNPSETHYFTKTQCTNELIQDYIGYENIQFSVNNTVSYISSVPSDRYLFNNFLNSMDNQNDNK